MKKVMVVVAMMLVSFPAVSSAGDNFHRGFHEGLGHIAAQATVGLGVGLLQGVFGGTTVDTYGDRVVVSPRMYTPQELGQRRGYSRAKMRHAQQVRRENQRARRADYQAGVAQGEAAYYEDVRSGYAW